MKGQSATAKIPFCWLVRVFQDKEQHSANLFPSGCNGQRMAPVNTLKLERIIFHLFVGPKCVASFVDAANVST